MCANLLLPSRSIIAVLPGTVNDATSYPEPDASHGSRHWVFERVLSAALVPVMGAAVAVNPGTGVYVSLMVSYLKASGEATRGRDLKIGRSSWSTHVKEDSRMAPRRDENTDDISFFNLNKVASSLDEPIAIIPLCFSLVEPHPIACNQIAEA
jgi:hypothetical protein